MKHIVLLIALLTFSWSASSQVFYESPYVFEGTSYRYTIPPGYDKVETGTNEFQMFSSDPDALSNMESAENVSDFIMIGLAENDGEEMDDIFDELIEENAESNQEELIVSSFQTSSQKDFRTLKGKVSFFTEKTIPTMIGISEFNEILTIVVIVDGDDGHDIDASLLEAMLSSYKEVETERENAFFPYEEPMNESDPRYMNNQFPTSLSHDYINLYPEITWETDAERFWESDWREDYQELLLAFMFTQIEGAEAFAGIKIFSGGYDDYTSGLDKLMALQKVFPTHSIEGLTNEETTLVGEMFSFKKYSIQSGSFEFTKQLLYITKIEGETVFVLGYMTEEPTDEMENEIENVVKTLEYEE